MGMPGFAAAAALRERFGVDVDITLHRYGCYERCQDDQIIARVKCAGRCANFVGVSSPLFDGCVQTCQRGEDYYRQPGLQVPSNILPGATVLRPGACDARCVRPYSSPVPSFWL